MADLFPASDSSVLVSFGDGITIENHLRVSTLFHAFEAQPVEGVTSVSPGYASVLFRYDPVLLSQNQIGLYISELLEKSQAQPEVSQTVELPVCYHPEFGLDLEELAAAANLSVADLIAVHTGAVYHAFFLGFAPGFAYLGEVDERIAHPRRPSARTLVPAGSVGIAGRQTGVYPQATPGGWNLIGRCPLALFHPDRTPPTLIAPGDKVQFRAIGREEFDTLSRSRQGIQP